MEILIFGHQPVGFGGCVEAVIGGNEHERRPICPKPIPFV